MAADLITLGSMNDDSTLQDGEVDVVKVGPKGKGSKRQRACAKG